MNPNSILAVFEITYELLFNGDNCFLYGINYDL